MTDTDSRVSPAPYVTIDLAAVITGLSAKAIRRKIEEGVWLEGREYRRAPDGRLYVSMKGYQQWVENGSSRSQLTSTERSGRRADAGEASTTYRT